MVYTTDAILAFGDGTYKLGYRSKDQAGNVEDLRTVEFKVDKLAPALSVQLDKTSIWPANHEMVTINAKLDASDATSGVESVVLTSITSNQPDSGQGDIQANSVQPILRSVCGPKNHASTPSLTQLPIKLATKRLNQ